MLSRLTPGNIVKIGLVVLLFPLVAFLVLLIGLGAKNKKVILEGSIYAVVFFIALSLPGDISAFAGLGSMAFAAVRSYMLRDLWLPKRSQKAQVEKPHHSFEMTLVSEAGKGHAIAPSTSESPETLSSALKVVSSRAKQNKDRLPADTYVTILETCQLLDSIIDAENLDPSSDVRFQYELRAVVREYLPAVLQGYLAIPLSMVDDRQPNGKTPNEELMEQLQLLEAQAETLYATRHRQSSVDLTTTGNFLRERFGHHLQDGFDFGIK
ncbi:hypothetical protein [Glutamicibacter sp. 0426]|uniref:hypothetical protein n=1 Tax=Glutamicibacter sp. 0426 TaxID=1913445 RepID=UPI00093BF60E|nr:hypothetical protein [Glutamicibacter sp. 0426]